MTTVAKIAEIEAEMARTQKNKVWDLIMCVRDDGCVTMGVTTSY
jgi:hypothetical protein